MTEKKVSIWKKIGFGLIYVLAIFGVLTIIAMLVSSGENTKNAYKHGDYVRNKNEDVLVSESDKNNCENRIAETINHKAKIKTVKGEEYKTNLGENFLSIEGIYKDGEGRNEIDREYNCIKDLDGMYGKNHNGLYVLTIDGEIIAQDM